MNHSRSTNTRIESSTTGRERVFAIYPIIYRNENAEPIEVKQISINILVVVSYLRENVQRTVSMQQQSLSIERHVLLEVLKE
jgi:hypothetical protein